MKCYAPMETFWCADAKRQADLIADLYGRDHDYGYIAAFARLVEFALILASY